MVKTNPHHHSPLRILQFQAVEGSQQPLRLNQNVQHRRRHRARRQQVVDSVVAVYSADSECEAETYISQSETRVHLTRVSIPKREVCVSLPSATPKCEVCISKPKCEVRIYLPECETRVEEQGLLKHDLHILTHKCEVRVQPPKAKNSAELESFTLMSSRLVLPIPLQ